MNNLAPKTLGTLKYLLRSVKREGSSLSCHTFIVDQCLQTFDGLF
jgi:hypothetical protein